MKTIGGLIAFLFLILFGLAYKKKIDIIYATLTGFMLGIFLVLFVPSESSGPGLFIMGTLCLIIDIWRLYGKKETDNK